MGDEAEQVIYFVFEIQVWTAVLVALLALGLALFSITRRAPVWVSVLPLLLVLALVLWFLGLILNVLNTPVDHVPVGLTFLFAILPAIIGYVALLAGRSGGAAPPGKDIQRVFVCLLPAFMVLTLILHSELPGGWYQSIQQMAEQGPPYQGRRLLGWVAEFEGAQDMDERKKAADAIRHFGTAALPRLLAWTDGRRMQFDVPQAFAVLGPQAAPAIPTLIGRSQKASDPNRDPHDGRDRDPSGEAAYRAMLTLCYLGPVGGSAMKDLMSNPGFKDAAEECAIKAGGMGSYAYPMIPSLVQFLRHRFPEVAWNAARSLGLLAHDPHIVVPALVESLDHPIARVRVEAARALMAFGDSARHALPALNKALSDPDEAVREQAAESIRKITPEATEKIAPEARTNAPPR